MIDKDELIELLAKVVKLAIEALPDSEAYEHCWEELSSEEQDSVKETGTALNIALQVYEAFKRKQK